MDEPKWKWVERVGWVIGIAGTVFGIVWAIATHTPPISIKSDIPGGSDSAPEKEPPPSSVQHDGPPPVASSSLADRQSVKDAFGNLMESRGESKFVAPSGNHEVMIRSQETLSVSDQDLIYEGTVREQDATEPWVTNSEPGYPLPGSRNPRMTAQVTACHARLAEIDAPLFWNGKIRLTCSAGDCWHCTVKKSNTFQAEPVDLKMSQRELEITPNDPKLGEPVSKAIKRLMTPSESYLTR